MNESTFPMPSQHGPVPPARRERFLYDLTDTNW